MTPVLRMGRTEMEQDSEKYLKRFMEFLKEEFSKRAILSELENIIKDHISTAGERAEDVFTRDFLCPTIAKFFYQIIKKELKLPDDEIKKGLGAEGIEHLGNFGFRPSRKKPHLFTKNEFFKDNIPDGWLQTNQRKLPLFQACPDFAIRNPLPFRIIGEVKFINSAGNPSLIFYKTIREAVFYLGVFRSVYDRVLLVFADATPKHDFEQSLSLFRPELLNRFGVNTDIEYVTLLLK